MKPYYITYNSRVLSYFLLPLLCLWKIWTLFSGPIFHPYCINRLFRFLEKTVLDRILKDVSAQYNSWSSFHLKKNELSTTNINRATYDLKYPSEEGNVQRVDFDSKTSLIFTKFLWDINLYQSTLILKWKKVTTKHPEEKFSLSYKEKRVE